MGDDRDDLAEDWRLIAYAAGGVSARYEISVDEAMHVLHFEACLFGLSLRRVAELAVSSAVGQDAAGGGADVVTIRAVLPRRADPTDARPPSPPMRPAR